MYATVGDVVKKEKSNVGIGILVVIALALCGGIGFFLLTNTLDLSDNSSNSISNNGGWCIKVNKISKPVITGNALALESSYEKTNIKFQISLDVNDSLKYEATLKNCGNVKAYYYGNELIGDNIDYTLSGIDEGDIINPGDEKSVSIELKAKNDKLEKSDIELKLRFSQDSN